MNESVEEFVELYHAVVTDCERFAFLPRAKSYQRQSIEKLTDLLDQSSIAKQKMIEESDEDAANQILALQCMTQALRFELKMWIDLKNQEWEKAWNALVDAQEYAQSARSAHDIASSCNVHNYIRKLSVIESFVFPPHTYNSPEIIVEEFLCTICNDDYTKCDHIAGRPYWGTFCNREYHNPLGSRGSAIVDNPKDKKARMTGHITDDRKIRNQMTWEKREMTDEEKEQFEDHTDGLTVFGIMMTASDQPVDFTEYFPE